MFKANNKNIYCIFIINFATYFTPFSSVSITDFEQVNVSWVATNVPLVKKRVN